MTKQSNVKLISRKYGVPFKSLKRWVLYGCDRKKGGGRKEKDPKMEAQLYEWYKEFGLFKKDGHFFRKGEIGDWLNYYTKDMSVILDTFIEKNSKSN